MGTLAGDTAILDVLEEIVVQYDDQDVVAWAAPSLRAALGFDPDQIVGTRFRIPTAGGGFFPTDLTPCDWQRVFAQTADGTVVWLEAAVRALPSGGCVVMARTIEAQGTQRAEDAELTSMRSAFAAAIDPFVLLTAVRDPDGDIIDFAYAEANEAACAYNGVVRADLLGSTLLTLMPVHAELGLIDRYAHVVNTGEPLSLDGFAFAYDPDSPPRRLDLRATKVADGLALTWRDVTERTAAAERLATSESRMALMLNTMSEGVMVHNLAGEVVEANRAARGILGLADGLPSPDARRIVELLAPDGSALTADQHPIRRALATGEPIRAEVMGVKRPGAEVLWLEATCEPMVVDGRTVGVLSTFSDITDSLVAERSLRQSEQRFRLLAENASEVVIQTGSDRVIVWVSPSVQTVLGYPPEEVVGRRLSEFLLPGEVERLQQEMAANIATHRAGGERRMKLRTANGSTRWMSVLGRAITDESGEVVGGVDALRDIHDQVLAQTRLQQLLDSLAEGVLVIDADGRLAECNPAAAAILGLTPAEMIGQPMPSDKWPLVDEDGQPLPPAAQPAAIALNTGQRVRDRVIGLTRPDGRMLWLLVSADPIADLETGERARVVTTFSDISARIDAQRRLQDTEARYRLLAENATDFVVYSDLKGVLRWVSPSVQRVLGVAPQDLVGKRILDFVHKDDLAKVRLRPDADIGHQFRIRLADGSWRWFQVSTKPLADGDGTIVGRVTGLQDVQAQVQAREELAAAHERLELVINASRLGVWDWNMQTGEVVFNQRWAEIIGYRLEELEPASIDTWVDFTHPGDREVTQRAIARHAAGETEFYDVECRIRHRDGRWIWVRDRGRIVEKDEAGQPLRMTGTHEDITALRTASDALAASEQRFRVAMASAPVGMAVLDLERRITQVNPALCALLARSEDWLVGRSMSEVVVADDQLLDLSTRRRLIDGDEQSITVDHRVIRGDQAQIWVQQSISLVRGAQGQVTGFVSQFTDITEARQARRRLRDLAARDPLTDLFNRREMTVRLRRWQESRAVEKLALLFIDLDGLKSINDSYGHLVGDEVIQQQAKRVLGAVRSDDVVGRFGGDEFIVVAPGLADPQQATELARRIQQVTRAPIQVEDLLVDVTCSIGVSITDVAVDFDRILARADAAVYKAKRAGRDQIVVFESESDS